MPSPSSGSHGRAPTLPSARDGSCTAILSMPRSCSLPNGKALSSRASCRLSGRVTCTAPAGSGHDTGRTAPEAGHGQGRAWRPISRKARRTTPRRRFAGKPPAPADGKQTGGKRRQMGNARAMDWQRTRNVRAANRRRTGGGQSSGQGVDRGWTGQGGRFAENRAVFRTHMRYH